jgi:pyruvate/2-oxoglutarate dehydrogenase complex dihydrolipoamide dehydrogenase (E3) component
MVYKDVATAVFTPLELGTVGLSEEEAVERYNNNDNDNNNNDDNNDIIGML